MSKREKNYIWKRLSEAFQQGEYYVFKEPAGLKDDPDILTEDVVQGELGDCYFLSALSAIAESPHRIKKMLPNQNIVQSGVFEAVVYVHGEQVRVIVDDYFPFHEHEEGEVPKLAFVGMNPASKNLWPAIMEKVWAKANLNYENIIAGNSSEAFEFLTPAPVDTWYHEAHKDRLFEELKEADEKGFIICTDITEVGSKNIATLAKMGLIPNHAYTIIDCAELTGPRGNKIQLLKIRNPWGTNEWTGDWSDKSRTWTDEYKKILNWDDAEDGTFWISYQDFIKYYTCTHVSKIHDDYHYVFQKYPFDKDQAFNMVDIYIPRDTHGYFVVNQKNTRIYRVTKGIEDFQNRYCSLIVFKKERGGKLTYVGAACGRDNRLYVEAQMTKGDYVICVSFPSHADRVNDYEELKKKQTLKVADDTITYLVGVYSSLERLDITTIGQDRDSLAKSFLSEITYDLAKNNKDKHYFTEDGEKDSWRAISFEKEAGAYGYILYENNSDGWINEHLTFTQFQNANLIPLLEHGDMQKLDLEDEDAIEDPHERMSVGKLRSTLKLESSVQITNVVPHDEEVTEDNPIELIIRVAPKSKCMILIEKYDEDAAVELSSQVVFTYSTHSLINERKFPAKRTRIRYNNKNVDIFESVIEHNSGVIFKYKNKTKDLKFSAHISFPELDNLKLSLKSEDLKDDRADNDKTETNERVDSYANVDPTALDVEIEDPSREIIISLEPGETKFFELTAVDVFDTFSYACESDYHINLARKK